MSQPIDILLKICHCVYVSSGKLDVMLKYVIVIKLGKDVYDEIPNDSVIASKALYDVWVKLGKPQDPICEQGQRMMKVITSVWEDLYPLEAKCWIEDRKEHLSAEMSIHDQVVKKTGRSLASYPLPIYRMMKKFFPGYDTTQRDHCFEMIRLYPMFRLVNII